jgi:hypothetical protein
MICSPETVGLDWFMIGHHYTDDVVGVEGREYTSLRDPLKRSLRVGHGALVRAEFDAHVQFENARHHDYGLGAIPILELCKFHCFGAVDEQATAEALLILDDPIAVAVLADTEKPPQ